MPLFVIYLIDEDARPIISTRKEIITTLDSANEIGRQALEQYKKQNSRPFACGFDVMEAKNGKR